MGTAPKRKKLEKTEATVPASSQKFICSRCGKAYCRFKGFFPVSHSPMYRGTGYLPWCNDCIDTMYDEYRMSLSDDREALRRMCMKMDLYWNDSIYDMVEKTAGVQSRIRNYIGKTNIIRYVDKTFDDTIKEDVAKGKEQTSDEFEFSYAAEDTAAADENEEPVEQAVIDFWGEGYSPSFYRELERRYNDWTGGAQVSEASDRSLYRQICLLETTISRDGARGKPIDKNVNALNTLLGSMNLKPAQRAASSDAELDSMPLGVGIQKWEYYRPLPETPKDLKDIRGTIKNITTWYLGHACKMVGLRNSYCKMYEDEMERLRVKRPEYDDEDDDTMLSDIFGGAGGGTS